LPCNFLALIKEAEMKKMLLRAIGEKVVNFSKAEML
jgi:hypothetical protein